jgi:hypothetical protein
VRLAPSSAIAKAGSGTGVRRAVRPEIEEDGGLSQAVVYSERRLHRQPSLQAGDKLDCRLVWSRITILSCLH